MNSVGRPCQVWLYNHKSGHRNLLFEENNPRYHNASDREQTCYSAVCATLKVICNVHSCTVDVAVTRDHKFITINSNTRTSSEVFQFYCTGNTMFAFYVGTCRES